MTPVPIRQKRNTNQRRSHRVMLSVGIVITGHLPNGHRFSEETFTSVVNAHGALILLTEEVTRGQLLTIRNVKSGEELQCEVVEIGESRAGKSQVAVEFVEPSPRFWRIAFPPEDWSARSPEAKGFVTQPVAPLKARVPK
ncbi:MAG: hypothetical protein JWN63_3074 [Candidatus Acidoferrum typicum]|nr:hypothetical protein [Candidatus Acidoferrum typicum]